MEYYQILNFKKEPFSNSPEPEFLFQSPQHTTCLQMLELAVRLRRGLNVVIGDVGTGKTTLCRKLIQDFSFTAADSSEIETHLLLDPALANTQEFLQTVALLLGIKDSESQQDEWHLKERIKNYLFSKGVDEEKIIVLIIDEGQKIPEGCLEVLREFLNYETNSQKLLQIIIFAQKEFQTTLKKYNNLSDRVNFLYYLKPLSFRQMRAMINYRIGIARDSEITQPLFSFGGLVLIYAATRGYPRKVVSLGHQVILMLIIRGQKKAGFLLVKNSISEMAKPIFIKVKWATASLLILMMTGILITVGMLQNKNDNAAKANASASKQVMSDIKMPEYMGSLRIKQGETLYTILQNIYGKSGIKTTQAVMLANQQIHELGKIKAGTILNFPSSPTSVKTIKEGRYFVQIENGKDMGNIYRFFLVNSNKQKIPKSVFFPYWNEKEGMTFAVVVDGYFDNPKSAQEKINKLSAAIRTSTKIISRWDVNTVIFNSHVFRLNE